MFARRLTGALATLIKQIDVITGENKAVGSYVVFLDRGKIRENTLKTLAAAKGIRHTLLTIDHPALSVNYGFAKQAEVTVLVYRSFTVRARITRFAQVS